MGFPPAEAGPASPGPGPRAPGETAAGAPGPLPATGDSRVDEAVARLDDLATLPVTEHPAVFEYVHERLAGALGDLDAGGLGAGDQPGPDDWQDSGDRQDPDDQPGRDDQPDPAAGPGR